MPNETDVTSSNPSPTFCADMLKKKKKKEEEEKKKRVLKYIVLDKISL
jgi:hypothetical protein